MSRYRIDYDPEGWTFWPRNRHHRKDSTMKDNQTKMMTRPTRADQVKAGNHIRFLGHDQTVTHVKHLVDDSIDIELLIPGSANITINGTPDVIFDVVVDAPKPEYPTADIIGVDAVNVVSPEGYGFCAGHLFLRDGEYYVNAAGLTVRRDLITEWTDLTPIPTSVFRELIAEVQG